MIFLTLVLGLILIIWFYKLNKSYHVLAFFAPRLRTIDGSPVDKFAADLPARTIFGNTFDVYGLDYGNL